MTKDMHVRLSVGHIECKLTAEGASYSPDALDDMVRQAIRAVTQALEADAGIMVMLEGSESTSDENSSESG